MSSHPAPTPAEIWRRPATVADLTAYRSLKDDQRLERRLVAQQTAETAERVFHRAWVGPVLAIITFSVGALALVWESPIYEDIRALRNVGPVVVTVLLGLLMFASWALLRMGRRYEIELANARTWVTGYAEMETRIATEQAPVRRRWRR